MKKGFRWVVMGLGTAIVLVAVGWCIWNAVAGARLRAALKDATDRGLPTRIEEVLPAPVPDADNAALLLNQAFLLMAGGKTEPGATLPAINELEKVRASDVRGSIPSGDAHEIRAKLQSPEIRKILELLHRAAERSACDFGLDYSEGATLALPHLGKMRAAAHLLALEGWAMAISTDAMSAMRSVRAGLRIGGFNLSEGLLISFLVGASCDTRTLEWADVSLGYLDPGVVPMAELEALSRELADRRARIRPAFVRTVDVERVIFGTWAFEGLLANRTQLSRLLAPLWDAASTSDKGLVRARALDAYAWVGRPLLKEDYAAYLRLMCRFRELAAQSYELAAVAEFDRLVAELPRMAILTRMTVPAYGACMKQAGQYEALMDIARAGLALEAHRARAGAYPERLADAPGIGDLAKDPFSGGELIYRREGDGCRLWSVGVDGKDDGGARRGGGAKTYDIVWEVKRAER